jgi:hypothetical protein
MDSCSMKEFLVINYINGQLDNESVFFWMEICTFVKHSYETLKIFRFNRDVYRYIC